MPEVNSNGMILAKDEENDAEVRREDQDKINEFGQLNARLHEIREESDKLKSLLEKIDDASTELMMGSGSSVMLRLGDALFESSEEDATEFCEREVERHQEKLDGLDGEMGEITDKMGALKKVLYGRFGKSINLEEK